MKKNIKSIMAITLSTSLMVAGVVNATAENNLTNNTTQNAVVTDSATSEIKIDDKTIENAKAIVKDNFVMLPARDVAEALGFTVSWNNEAKRIELVNGAMYVTFRIGTDGYTFSRTAPMPLGIAPTLIDGATYVPVELFSDILEYKVEVKDGVVTINTDDTEDEVAENEMGEGVVSSIDKEEKQVLVNDSVKGDVILNINDDTIIVSEDGNDLTIDDIKEGSKVKVEYSEAMTMSLPPINNPIKIIVSAEEDEMGEGVVSSIDKEQNQILINDNVKGEVMLNINDDTIIVSEDGNDLTIDDIKEGSKVKVEYSEAMTMSLPPINNPIKIVVSVEENEMGNAVVSSIDKEEKQVLVNDSIKGNVMLNINDDTIIVSEDGKDLTFADFKEGSKVKVEYSEVMTRSIPPINNPIKIVITD